MIEFQGKQIQAAIFDMDGTMFDTERLRFKTLNQASRELTGKPITETVLMGSLGLSAKRAEALAKSYHSEDYPYAEIRKRGDELELSYVRTYGVPVKTGLIEVLERLRKSGLVMAVATSSRRAIAEEYLINANVLKYFDITVCGDEVKQGKPHPEIFLRAAAALNTPPDQCLMFEDSENGLRSAAGAGGQAILIEDIKVPTAEMHAQALRSYGHMLDFLDELVACTPAMGVPALTEPFPQAMNQMRAGIHGFGAMGGGYLAQIFSHWDGYTRPCEIVATTGDATLRELVNAFGKYSVRYGAYAFDQTIDNVRLVDMADEAAVIDMYRACEVVGLSLPEVAIRGQAELIARGLVHRFEQNGRDLTILVVLNKVSGASFVRKQVQAALARVAHESIAAQIMAKTHFAETVVNRIASKLTRDALLRQARIKFELFEKNLLESTSDDARKPAPAARRGSDISRIAHKLRHASRYSQALGDLHLILFNSEPDMALYAQHGSPMLARLRQVRKVDDIGQIQLIKNRLWNGTHAIVAWYASLLGYETIGQGMGDDRIAALAIGLIKREIEPAMLREQPAMQPILASLTKTFIARCRASFKDPCARVGRDPLRKLQRSERVLGSIALAARHGIETPALEYGVALGILRALRTGAPLAECRRVRELYGQGHSLADVLAYDGPYNGKPYPGLDRQRDAALIARISRHFALLQDPDSDHWNWPLAWLESGGLGELAPATNLADIAA
ncbi:HAD-IA family hydrolase [Verticiella sediminum]|uniref:HAD-IA family hydrolase n=1 Tax=Verticiella sediminum TaxID=1247510 RepID=A0A556A5W3_9BURK|nr:HAD family hydrolase [Verticiella sediminum]TSH88279.1 HAD-IA family hydrolase [Verticiella sediminum]